MGCTEKSTKEVIEQINMINTAMSQAGALSAEHFKQFDKKIDNRFDKLEQKFDQQEHKIDNLEQKFELKFDNLKRSLTVGFMNKLIILQKLDVKFYEKSDNFKQKLDAKFHEP